MKLSKVTAGRKTDRKVAKKSSPSNKVLPNTHRKQVHYQGLGIALIDAGTFIERKLSLAGLEDLAVKVAERKLPKTGEPGYWVIQNLKGCVVRKAQRVSGDICRVGKGFISPAVLSNCNAKFYTVPQFSKLIKQQGQGVSLQFRSSKEQFTGIHLGKIADSVGTLLLKGKDGNYEPMEFELQANAFNLPKRAAIIQDGMSTKGLLCG